MGSLASFLVVNDPRGDLECLSRTVELAARRDVAAQAVFFFGNIAGPILTPEELAELNAARPILAKELNDRHDHYESIQIRDFTQLGLHMTQNAANYRRTNENNALRTVRALVGLRDANGRWVESGRAVMRAKRFYGDAEKVFKKSTVPVYVMADTILLEDLIDASRWLHFAWMSLGPAAVRALCMTSGDLSDSVPELAPGARRGGKPVALSEYPLASGDIIFSPQINPALHEVLSEASGKVAIIIGDGVLDRTYHNILVSTQKAGNAYYYKVEGSKVTRRFYPFTNRVYVEPTKDEVSDTTSGSTNEHTIVRRRELEEQAKLAGLGKDLIQFMDMMRAQNPKLADTLSRAQNRTEAIVSYVKDMEEQSRSMDDLLSTQRAGMERLVKALEPYIGVEALQRINEMMTIPSELQRDLATWDAVNAKIALMVAEALKARDEALKTGARR